MGLFDTLMAGLVGFVPQAETKMGHVTVYKQHTYLYSSINNANHSVFTYTYLLLLCTYSVNMDDLETARISSLPQAGFYIADFITQEEEAYLLHKVLTSLTFT